MRIPPLRRHVRAWSLAGRVPRRIWNRLPIPEPAFEVALPDGRRMRYRTAPGDAIGQALYWRGLDGWERATIHAFLALAVRARRFLDIGANTGAYTLLACTCNPDLHAIAYEPVPRVFARLADNLRRNEFGPRCEARQVAVSDRVGVTELHVPDTAVPSSASLHRSGFRDTRGRLIEVPVTTADADAAAGGPDEQPVDLVKIDVEGFEDRVLAGMTRILREHRPVIICECNPDGPIAAIDDQLRAAGYRFWHVREPRLQPMSSIVPDPDERYRNFVCVPGEDTDTAGLLDSLRL